MMSQMNKKRIQECFFWTNPQIKDNITLIIIIINIQICNNGTLLTIICNP